ncbi:MAG: diacylglycerol kinase family protein, partial [Verrucomicrobiota bacterium]
MIVILNKAAGQKPAEDPKKIRELFRERGVEAEVVHAGNGANLAEIACKAVKEKARTIVAGGGDGTISTVAAALVGTEKRLGVLPLGTLNHFAKDLKIPLELEKAVNTIAGGYCEQVDVGEVNGTIFINNSSLGLYPRIVRKREQQQERLGRGKWPAFLSSAIDAFRRYPFLDLRITLEGEKLFRRTAFL